MTHEMTKEELAEAGRKLFGPAWKGKLAEAIHWSRFTVYRWASGRTEVHPSAAKEIRALARKEGV